MAAAWLDPSDPRIDGVIDRLIRDEPRWLSRHSPRWLVGIAEHDGGGSWLVLGEETLSHPRQERLWRRLFPPR